MKKTVNIAGLLALSLLVPALLTAQVGHPPEHSPYHDLRAKQAASFVAGYLGGSQGKVGLGPSDGPIFGLRYDRLVGNPIDIQLGLSYAHLSRFLIDPSRPVATRTTGPEPQDLVMMEAGVSLVMMGRKTWHGFSPFVGGTFGVAFETGLDTTFSGYQFSSKGFLAPHAGIKWFPMQAFAIKAEVRDYVWRLSYPESFAVAPAVGIPAVLPTTRLTEWTHHPTLLVSVGYTFTF